ncbi:MAG: hypothetical protein P1U35_12935 [Cycloclasticus sp.]|nr:hypothetical protein [Cycloclasticus sp.]
MFDNESFSHVGGSSPAPRIYTYETTEDRTIVLGSGYFNQAYTKLQVKDLIIVNNSIEVYTAKVTAVSKNSVTVQKTSFLDREYAYYYLDTETVLTLNNDGVTYTQIPNMSANPVRDFTLDGDTLTYTGVGGLFQFVGSIDMSTQKTADVTIALSINDVISPQQVVASYPNANKRRTSSSNGIFSISTGDEFKVMIKGDGTTGLVVDIFSMNVTFMEV